MNKTQKAVIAKVNIGNVEIEGLMLPDGNFGVAIPQISDIFLDTRNYGSQTLNRLMGKDFKTHKAKTDFNKNVTNYVTLLDFEKVVAHLDRAGNKKAQNFRDDLIGLSLNQLFSDAFNIKFEQQERQNWLKIRQQGKQIRRTLTDSIKDWLSVHHASDNEKRFIYATVTDMINLGIFNRKAQNLKVDWRCHNPRDLMNDNELRWVSEVEDLAMRLIDYKGFTLYDGAREAINRLSIPLVFR
jgi:hypothetical protein